MLAPSLKVRNVRLRLDCVVAGEGCNDARA